LVLAALGALAAWTGGARIAPSALRFAFWGALTTGVTAGAGGLFGAVV
jgi:VIT1/CCC1 family predicted Fe2+/Mn2+ transporter